MYSGDPKHQAQRIFSINGAPRLMMIADGFIARLFRVE
jgi:hypothetical protein